MSWAGTTTLTIGVPPSISRPAGYSSTDSCAGPISRATSASAMRAALLRWSACSSIEINTANLNLLQESEIAQIKASSGTDATLKAALCALANQVVTCQGAPKANDECQTAISNAVFIMDKVSNNDTDPVSNYYVAYSVDMPQSCQAEALCNTKGKGATLPVLTPSPLGNSFELLGSDPNDNYENIHSFMAIYDLYFSRYQGQPFNFFNASGQCLKWGSVIDPDFFGPGSGGPVDVWVPCASTDRITHVICR